MYVRENFIERAKEIHGDKYDYSKVEYKNANVKVCIICPIHGEFWQTPNKHINRKHGCPKCGIKKNSQNRSLNIDEFIIKAKEVHKDKYDYSKTEYVNFHTKVCIICNEHGEFWQIPSSHLKGHGCPKCKNSKISKKNAMNKENFIQKAKSIHGDKYDYSKVEYINNSTNVCITCPIHGEFWQTPSNHLQCKGCAKCNQSHLENDIYNFLKENKIDFETQKKFEWLGYQSLDFYLPQYNIGIECQGIQHFKPVKHFGDKKTLIYTQNCDKQKQQLCDEHHIKILYYSNLGIEYPYEVIENKEKLLEKIKL